MRWGGELRGLNAAIFAWEGRVGCVIKEERGDFSMRKREGEDNVVVIFCMLPIEEQVRNWCGGIRCFYYFYMRRMERWLDCIFMWKSAIGVARNRRREEMCVGLIQTWSEAREDNRLGPLTKERNIGCHDGLGESPYFNSVWDPFVWTDKRGEKFGPKNSWTPNWLRARENERKR